MTQAVQYTLEQFGEDVRRTLAAWGNSKSGVLCLGPILQRLAREGGPLHELGEPATLSSGLAGRRLYKDPADGFLLPLGPVRRRHSDRRAQPRGLGRHLPPHGQRALHQLAARRRRIGPEQDAPRGCAGPPHAPRRRGLPLQRAVQHPPAVAWGRWRRGARSHGRPRQAPPPHRRGHGGVQRPAGAGTVAVACRGDCIGAQAPSLWGLSNVPAIRPFLLLHLRGTLSGIPRSAPVGKLTHLLVTPRPSLGRGIIFPCGYHLAFR